MKCMDTKYEIKFADNNEVVFILENDYLCKEDDKPKCICMTDTELRYLLALLIEKYNIASRNELLHKISVDDELLSIKTKVLDVVIGGSLL